MHRKSALFAGASIALAALIFLMSDSTPAASASSGALTQVATLESPCLTCHQGIEDIRDPNSGMMLQISAIGERFGDTAGCTVCHGGNPQITDDPVAAHEGAPSGIAVERFYPDPGSIWISEQPCGQCHAGVTYALERSLMNTEAGKIQGNMFTWTVQKDHDVIWGNYDVDDPDGPEPSFGTDTYKEYMLAMIEQYPGQFPSSLEQLPNPSLEDIIENPFNAGFTYQRQQCQRCHVGIKGRQVRGDYRGMGCSSCHIPYSNEGIYEGNDPTISKQEPGKLLTHRMVGSREALGGIPTETCVTCHNRGKRIGVTFQGLMEFPYGTPFTEAGEGQPALHTKKYLYIQDDLHHQRESRPGNPEGGMLCQDCHTSIEMHGDGNIFGTTLAQVEIECADCHGTPSAYPWELPIGYQEEFGRELGSAPRGLTDQLLPFQGFGTVYPAEDGYLLTTRGNPFGNVVLSGESVIVHSATGLDFEVPLLKKLQEDDTWKSEASEVSMESVGEHIDELECYACHSDWAPQCYGCHVKASYEGGGESTDWVQIGNTRFPDGLTIAEYPDRATEAITSPGVVFGTSPGESPGAVNESRSYLRWEEPILGINGEGRVSPLMPGCQVIKTVVGPDGELLLHNAVGRAPESEGGALAIDMAPVQPHSATRVARTCASCHSDPKALGYGIQDGRYQRRYPENIIVDLETPEGEIWADSAQVQIAAIPELNIDFSQIVSRDGTQLQIVGSHWPDSRPLDQDQRERMERTGVCMGCHRNMASPDFWQQEVVAKYGVVVTDDEHIETMDQVLKDAVSAAAAPDAGATPTTTAPDTPVAAPPAEDDGGLGAGWIVFGVLALLAFGITAGMFGRPLVEYAQEWRKQRSAS